MNCCVCGKFIYVKVMTRGDYYCWKCHGELKRDLLESSVKRSEAERRIGMLGGKK